MDACHLTLPANDKSEWEKLIVNWRHAVYYRGKKKWVTLPSKAGWVALSVVYVWLACAPMASCVWLITNPTSWCLSVWANTIKQTKHRHTRYFHCPDSQHQQLSLCSCEGTTGFSFGSFGAKTTASTAFGFGPAATTTTASSGFGSKSQRPPVLTDKGPSVHTWPVVINSSSALITGVTGEMHQSSRIITWLLFNVWSSG